MKKLTSLSELKIADIELIEPMLDAIEAIRVKLLEHTKLKSDLFLVDRLFRLQDHRAAMTTGKWTFAPLCPKHTPLPAKMQGGKPTTGLSVTWQLCRPRKKPGGGIVVSAYRHLGRRDGDIYPPEVLLPHALPCEMDLVWRTECEFALVRAFWRPYGKTVAFLKSLRNVLKSRSARHAERLMKHHAIALEMMAERRVPWSD